MKSNSFVQERPRIKIISVGNGGFNILKDLEKELQSSPLYKDLSFLAIDTEEFSRVPSSIKTLFIGKEFTKGYGTGNDPALGEKIFKTESKTIKEALKGTHLGIIIGSLGGGTGSGGAPIVAQILGQLGALSLGVFTMPFEFEGEVKKDIAQKALKKLYNNLNGLIIISNELIFSTLDRKTPLQEAFRVINKETGFRLAGLFRILSEAGTINIDFADLRNILKNKKSLVFINRVRSETPELEENIIEKAFSTPIFPYKLGAAKNLLLHLCVPRTQKLSLVHKASSQIFEKAGKSSKVIFGLSFCQENLEINLLASHLKVPPEFSFLIEKQRPGPALPSKPSSKRTKKKKTSSKKRAPKKEVSLPTGNNKKRKEKIRKNALELKKSLEEAEKAIREREELLEIPAIWRQRKNGKAQS